MPDLKPELSKKSSYWIPRHRYYELKHFCLQYPDWKGLYSKLHPEVTAHKDQEIRGTDIYRPNEDRATLRADLQRAMNLVEQCAKNCTDEEILRYYIFKAVTNGFSFVQLQTRYEIPCSKDMYYECYRKFFWLLSREKGI